MALQAMVHGMDARTPNNVPNSRLKSATVRRGPNADPNIAEKVGVEEKRSIGTVRERIYQLVATSTSSRSADSSQGASQSGKN